MHPGRKKQLGLAADFDGLTGQPPAVEKVVAFPPPASALPLPPLPSPPAAAASNSATDAGSSSSSKEAAATSREQSVSRIRPADRPRDWQPHPHHRGGDGGYDQRFHHRHMEERHFDDRRGGYGGGFPPMHGGPFAPYPSMDRHGRPMPPPFGFPFPVPPPPPLPPLLHDTLMKLAFQAQEQAQRNQKYGANRPKSPPSRGFYDDERALHPPKPKKSAAEERKKKLSQPANRRHCHCRHRWLLPLLPLPLPGRLITQRRLIEPSITSIPSPMKRRGSNPMP